MELFSNCNVLLNLSFVLTIIGCGYCIIIVALSFADCT